MSNKRRNVGEELIGQLKVGVFGIIMGNYPYVWVEYWPVNSTHAHQLIISTGDAAISEVMVGIEGYAEELSESIIRCNEDRHKGHGRSHPPEEAEKAYKAAVAQLFDRDFEAETLEMKRKQRVFKKWGGQPPAALLLPTQDHGWQTIITNQEGDPAMYPVRPGILDDIAPDPREVGAKPDEEGLGFRRKRKLKAETKLKRLRGT